MTSFQGYTLTAYEAISPYKLYLNLGSNDRDFQQTQKDKKEEVVKVPTFITKNIELFKDDRYVNFLHLVDKISSEFYKLIEFDYTLFIPIDTFSIMSTDIRNILKYHSLNYTLIPSLLDERVSKIESRLTGHYITIYKNRIVPEIGTVAKIIESKRIGNGYVYLIDTPLNYYF